MSEPDVPIIIVGGGPVGLMTSIMLSRMRVRHALFERHPGTSVHPKAVGLNQRTSEIFRDVGIADEVAALAAPPHTVGGTSWHTSFAGPTPLHGRQIAARDAWGGGRYAEEYRAASPAPYLMIPQIRLEPVLKRAAESYAEGEIRFGHEVELVTPEAEGARVTIRTPEGSALDLTARFVIVADGGRSVAAQLGITETGPRDLVDMVSAHVTADLSAILPHHDSLIHWFVNPDLGGSIGAGYLYHIGPWDDRGASREWVFAAASIPGDPVRFDEAGMRLRMQRTLGVPDLELEVNSISHWHINAVVADRFRQGDVFLVGDAAHRIPPWGALGLNTGVQDAHNLAWKLAAALADPAFEPLLDTYDRERRRIARNVADTSLRNFQNHGGIVDRALGLEPGQQPDDGWRALGELWASGARGDARRAAVAEAMTVLDQEFHAHGTEIGFGYPEGALIPEDGSDQDSFGALVYEPSTVPGHHLPHCWLVEDGVERSTLDLQGPGRWALIVDDRAEAWRDSLSASDAPLAAHVDVIEVGVDRAIADVSGAWASTRDIESDGAILVRPDAFVAWRARTSDGIDGLDAALRTLSGAPVGSVP
ncbi:FAD-dependent monooxygenase [Agromyces aerolatus]|uniref:FAD-dependent monooxygenase n=1 Tax=Agromyces sp. LY-1074 TaxID=3074080 RepID=UPI00285E6A29|nr:MULTISPECIES: FAD-dependent monooxygenase [unclassified Agromyces]MDR5698675.1 FAD-dependent monooxygenase [Agromyces sp. LY-1074]MDR5704969.1 FAD-dependent monooxygenase [Agromyces sp. LY-1358]